MVPPTNQRLVRIAVKSIDRNWASDGHFRSDLKQAEMGMAVADLTRRLGISEQTFYRWKKQYAGLQADQVRELKQLQEENARLKKLVAELSLDKAMLQDVAAKKWGGPR